MPGKLFPETTPEIKRLMDITLSVTLLILLTPVLIIISILVAWQHGSPILFRQKRPGFHGEIFTIYKFRTMRDMVDDQGILLPDAKRLTKLGRFLRATSLDELPEFINILKGEMSFVGPRPLLISLQFRTIQAARCSARDDRLGTSSWKECPHMAGEIRPRYLVC